MNIIFSPSLDKGYYANLSQNSSRTLGTKIIGLLGLLEHLSLHNGLSGIYASDGERASAYMSHVGKYANDSIIETSFKNDALGVTKCLLHWRDMLIMAGWNPSDKGDATTPKLKLLSQIESSWKAQSKGAADRWLELAILSKSQSLIANGDSIECKCAKASLPRLVQDVLVACKATFTELPEDVQIPDVANIQVVHYNDLTDAYRQVASNMAEYKNTVIVNRDNVSLNHILFSWGKPLVGATIAESNPLTLQLFKLAMSVFSRPLNIQNLLSYLQLPVGPVPGKLRYALANILTKDGGFGEIDWDSLPSDKVQELKKANITTRWDLAVYDYINEEDDEKPEAQRLTKVQRQSKATLLKYITDTVLDKNKNIPVSILWEYISAINKWAAPIANNRGEDDEMLKSQLSTVVSYFKQLADALDGVTEISYQELEKHVRTIYQPMTITQAHAQVGSLNVVNNCSQLLDAPDNLLWLDCCGADEITDQYEFLSTAELTWLNSQDSITIPKLQDILDFNRKEMIAALSQIQGKITLVASDYHHNQKMAEHPIIAELRMQRGDSLRVKEGEFELPLYESQDIKKIEPKLQYELGSIKYKGRSESNTSIDTLINYPFDYTAHYIAKLSEPSKKELGSIQKLTGLVAHSFIQGLVETIKDLPLCDRISTMESLLKSEYDTRLEKAINTTGLSLLLKENEVDYNNMRFLLKHSIEVLIKIMEKKELVPVGCELRYDKSLGDVISDFNARIDMELEDADGNAVIFDFKWSYAKFYGEKIKEGKAVQLELYRRELQEQGKNVTAVGYYLFPKCVLETPDFEILKDDDGKVIINHIDPPQDTDLFEQIQKSILQRKNEISMGSIEEGEGMDIKDLPYSQKILKGTNMLLVGKIKRDGRVSKKNPDPQIKEIKKDSNKVFTNKPESRFFICFAEFNNNNTPLNETPTTYPLMKGRLK